MVSEDGPVQLYRNRHGEDLAEPRFELIWSSNEVDQSRSVAWADLNGDSFLDFVVGNQGQRNRIYINQRGKISNLDSFVPLVWPVAAAATRSVAWGDYDGDGDLDLAVGNYGQKNQIYENKGILNGLPQMASTPIYESAEMSNTTTVAWGDWDNDGDLDIAIGNENEKDQVYVNRRDPLAPTNSVQFSWVWSSAEAQATSGLAWGDVDGDGDLDLAVSQIGGGSNHNGYYENTSVVAAHTVDEYRSAIPLPINPNYLSVERPNGSEGASFYAKPEILSGPSHPTVTVPFRIFDPDGIREQAGSNGIGDSIPVDRLRFEYSLNDGGKWQAATGDLINTDTVGVQSVKEYKGQGATELTGILLPAGPVKFEIKHDGIGIFTVWLLDPQGNLSALLAEKTGAFDGENEIGLPSSGTYGLRIQADGEWIITIDSATSGSQPTTIDSVTPTRLGQEYKFIWDAQADAAISENARFRVSLVQGNDVGPVKEGGAAAASPPFRVRGTTCVWPQGLSFFTDNTQNASDPLPLGAVIYTGRLDEGTGVMSFTWDFGDGTVLFGQRVTHSYLLDGVYTLTLTVRGAACPYARTVTIVNTVKVGEGFGHLYLPLVFQNAPGRAGSDVQRTVRPGAVDDLAGRVEADSLLLTWSSPTTGGLIESYRIYASQDGGGFQPVGVTGANRTAFTVRGQPCGRAYLITAQGPGGEGPDSLQSYLAPACETSGGNQ